MQTVEVPSPRFSGTSLFIKALKYEAMRAFNTLLNWILQLPGKEGTPPRDIAGTNSPFHFPLVQCRPLHLLSPVLANIFL